MARWLLFFSFPPHAVRDGVTISGRPWKRPSQQLQPRKVSCLQTQHLQDNYEHWVNILKEENRLKEQQQQQQQQGAAAATAASSSTSPRAATAPAAEDDHAASEDEDDDGDDGESDDCDDDDDDEESQAGVVGADVVVAAAPSPHQDEMETIQEVEEGALGGQGSTKTSPCEAASSAVRTQGGAKTLATVDDAVVSGASHPRPLPPSPLSAGPATPGREQRSSFPTPLRPRKVLPGTDRPLGRSAPENNSPHPTAAAERMGPARNNSLWRQSSYQEQALGTPDTPQTDTRLRRSRPEGSRMLAERRRLSLRPLGA
ncbi:hypothetical protein HPB49_015848 [Dermacentor silvarum]|uniref:Uncharacterized protein n=1 Tax=Dermacentor silvarum TaxID=543639 RepID=A0ACB8C4E0_DERSI|nr:hypothetical protein HPB49_015848 [Dermacentor silvarum]